MKMVYDGQILVLFSNRKTIKLNTQMHVYTIYIAVIEVVIQLYLDYICTNLNQLRKLPILMD